MKNGKVSENILKRSVLKEIKYCNDYVVNGAAVGRDCAIFTCHEAEEKDRLQGAETDGMLQMTTNVVTEDSGYDEALAIHTAVNNLAAGGAKALAVETALLFPGQCSEEELKRCVRKLNHTCEELGTALAGGHTEITRAVRQKAITVTGIGKSILRLPETIAREQELDVVMTKWTGLAGTAILAEKKEKELAERFPVGLIDEAKAFDKFFSIVPEAATAMKSNVKAMHDISKGGVFGALWEMAERFGIGLQIDLKKIPIRQETVEICNFLDVNPYELLSTGSLLLLAENGEEVVSRLREEGIAAAVIGRTKDSNDRLLQVDDEIRYLTRPVTDEIVRFGII